MIKTKKKSKKKGLVNGFGSKYIITPIMMKRHTEL